MNISIGKACEKSKNPFFFQRSDGEVIMTTYNPLFMNATIKGNVL
jgi:hypothetical protein